MVTIRKEPGGFRVGKIDKRLYDLKHIFDEPITEEMIDEMEDAARELGSSDPCHGLIMLD